MPKQPLSDKQNDALNELIDSIMLLNSDSSTVTGLLRDFLMDVDLTFKQVPSTDSSAKAPLAVLDEEQQHAQIDEFLSRLKTRIETLNQGPEKDRLALFFDSLEKGLVSFFDEIQPVGTESVLDKCISDVKQCRALRDAAIDSQHNERAHTYLKNSYNPNLLFQSTSTYNYLERCKQQPLMNLDDIYAYLESLHKEEEHKYEIDTYVSHVIWRAREYLEKAIPFTLIRRRDIYSMINGNFKRHIIDQEKYTALEKQDIIHRIKTGIQTINPDKASNDKEIEDFQVHVLPAMKQYLDMHLCFLQNYWDLYQAINAGSNVDEAFDTFKQSHKESFQYKDKNRFYDHYSSLIEAIDNALKQAPAAEHLLQLKNYIDPARYDIVLDDPVKAITRETIDATTEILTMKQKEGISDYLYFALAPVVEKARNRTLTYEVCNQIIQILREQSLRLPAQPKVGSFETDKEKCDNLLNKAQNRVDLCHAMHLIDEKNKDYPAAFNVFQHGYQTAALNYYDRQWIKDIILSTKEKLSPDDPAFLLLDGFLKDDTAFLSLDQMVNPTKTAQETSPETSNVAKSTTWYQKVIQAVLFAIRYITHVVSSLFVSQVPPSSGNTSTETRHEEGDVDTPVEGSTKKILSRTPPGNPSNSLSVSETENKTPNDDARNKKETEIEPESSNHKPSGPRS